MRLSVTLGLSVAVVLCALLLMVSPALPQSLAATSTPTPRSGYGFDPVRATLHSAYSQATAQATPRTSTRGYDPVMATLAAAYSATSTPTPTVQTYTRGYDPLFLTVQAWAQPATPTPTEPPCAWMWASQPLVAQSGRVQAGIDATGAQGVSFEASAFGENCVDAVSGDIRRFIARDVVFRLSVAGGDAAALGDALALALPVVNMAVKVESRPLAEIRVIFTDADLDPLALTPTMLDRVVDAELTGAALLARLYAVSLR